MRVFLWIFLILISETSLFAQARYTVSGFVHETGDFFSQPVKWRGNDWLKLGLLTAGTVLTMQVDQPIRDAVLREQSRYYHSVPIEAGRIWGDWYTPPVLASGFALHGWLADKASSKKIAFELVQAVTYAEAVTQVTKFVLGRARPYENEGAFSYHPFNISSVGFRSLPGGHNTEGWAMSTVLAQNSHSNVVKILVYIPSVLTFISRVYQDKHWTSDDLSGAIVGFLVGSWVVKHHENKESAVDVSAMAPFTVRIRF